MRVRVPNVIKICLGGHTCSESRKGVATVTASPRHTHQPSFSQLFDLLKLVTQALQSPLLLCGSALVGPPTIRYKYSAGMSSKEAKAFKRGWAAAINTVADHLDKEYIVWTSAGKVTVYDSQEEMFTGRVQAQDLTKWMRTQIIGVIPKTFQNKD